MMSIRAVNSLSHYTDWTIGHVHSGALGWVGMVTFGMIYWLVPRLWGRPLHYASWATTHFWLATIGIVLYVVSMWVAGITQGLMWRAIDADGLLQYPTFIDTVLRLMPFYWIRLVGGLMYLTGMVMLVWNVLKTAAAAPAPVPVPVGSTNV